MTLLDSNILVHATTRASAHHEKAKALCEQALDGRLESCVALQNLCEWYAVVTDGRRITHPLTTDEAGRELEAYLTPSPLTLLTVTPAVVQQLPALLRRSASRGAHVFDVLLVATMLAHGVTTIYTENIRDFSAFRDIRAVNPFV